MVDLSRRDDRAMEISNGLMCDAAPGDDGGSCARQVADLAAKRIAELEDRIRKASDMIEDDGRFGNRAHEARRDVWNTLAGELQNG